jgi:membrane protein required for colicin V production
MVDFVLGAALLALLIRGWSRGFVREALALASLVLGTWFAFALSPWFGDFLTKSFGITPEVARIGGGVLLFVLFGTALTIAAFLLTRVMRLPGLNTVNRLGGATVAVTWGVALMLVIINVAKVTPLPAALDSQLEESVVVEAIAGPTALPQRVFYRLAGDSALAALAQIQSLFGTSRVVPQGEQVIVIPPARPDELRQVRDEAEMILGEVNRSRSAEGLGALVTSDGLVTLAETRAVESYVNGTLSRDLDCLAEATTAGLSLAVCADAVALASTALSALDGILASDEGGAAILDSSNDRAGVAVVDGPTGRLLLIILGG